MKSIKGLIFKTALCNLLILVHMLCVGMLLFTPPVFAVDVAPRISDKEIIEELAKIREEQANIRGDIKKLEAKVEGDIKELN